jgi:hypothetical protein
MYTKWPSLRKASSTPLALKVYVEDWAAMGSYIRKEIADRLLCVGYVSATFSRQQAWG